MHLYPKFDSRIRIWLFESIVVVKKTFRYGRFFVKNVLVYRRFFATTTYAAILISEH
jgi:hypothetical protein